MDKHMADFSEILIEITGGTKPITSIKVIADVMGVDVQTVYGYRSGPAQPKWNDGCRLAKHLIREHGYYRLAYQTLLHCTGGQTDGRVEDQMLHLLEYGTDTHRAFVGGNESEFWAGYAKMEKELKTLKNEGERRFS